MRLFMISGVEITSNTVVEFLIRLLNKNSTRKVLISFKNRKHILEKMYENQTMKFTLGI